MTPDEVIKRVAEIAACCDDPEGAHGMEDDLYEDILRGIVAGDADVASIAKEALKTKEIDFPRWCA